MIALPQKLIEGFRRFRPQHDALYLQLVEQGQTPKVLVVACCDSRVDPALVFDCAPGDLFVIRNVANLVPPIEGHSGHHGTTAAIEYGVRNLNVQHLIVLGHAHCGGIGALLQNGSQYNEDSYLADWMDMVAGVRREVMRDMPDAAYEEQRRACEQRAILVSLENLMTFPWVRERVTQGTLTLHGWYFDIEHGKLLGYSTADRRFESL